MTHPRGPNWPPAAVPRPRSPHAHEASTRCPACQPCPCTTGRLTQYRVTPTGRRCTACPGGAGVACHNLIQEPTR